MVDQRCTVREGGRVAVLPHKGGMMQSGTINGNLEADSIMVLAARMLYLRTTPLGRVSATHSMMGNQGYVGSVKSDTTSSSKV